MARRAEVRRSRILMKCLAIEGSMKKNEECSHSLGGMVTVRSYSDWRDMVQMTTPRALVDIYRRYNLSWEFVSLP